MSKPISSEDTRLVKIISRVAALVAISLAILPPVGYFFLSYQSQARETAAEAEISANILIQSIVAGSQPWQISPASLKKFAEKDLTPSDLPETRRILGSQNQVLAESGGTLRKPVITRTHPLELASNGTTGRVEITRSLTPIVSNTILIALISLYFGFDAFAILHIMPLRALRRLFSALHDEKERAEVTLASISDAVISTSSTGQIEYLNPTAQRLTGWTGREANGRPLGDVLRVVEEKTGAVLPSPLERLANDVTINSMRQGGQLISRDGFSHFIEMAVSSVWDAQQGVIGYVLILHDTTMARLAEQSIREREERLRVVIENATDAIITLDDIGRIETFNPAAEHIFGFPAGEVYGWHLSALIPGTNPAHATNITKGDELAGIHKNGNMFPLEMSVSEAFLSGKRKLVAIVRDITERKHAEERLTFLANYDSLTGLPNRSLFRDRLAQAMMRAHRTESLVAVLFLDLDRFKTINDSLGHDSGDTLLKHVAERLIGALRKSDTISRLDSTEDTTSESATVARLGGDEFIIVLEGITHADQAAVVAQKVIDAFGKPFSLGTQEVFVSTSVGISVFPHDDNDLDMLIKDADSAMYRAKDLGRNNYQFYTQDMNTAVHELLQMEGQLRHALERSEFSLHYQPKIDIPTGRVTGVEALLRWQNPVLGSVSPAKFIPVLEDTGIIIAVGEWVLRTACTQAKSWQAMGLEMSVAVNLSARQFYQKNLALRIGEILSETTLAPDKLELEITESLLMEHSEVSNTTLAELKARGIKISIDDFGTGYSSLSYLKRFPIDTLKIDQSFVRDITTNPDDAAITTGIIALAHSLRLTVIAEGVETLEQLDFLRTHGCDQFQGYYMSRPLPPDKLEEWLKARSE